MPAIHTITFYPVGNGDTCQIVLAGGKRVLFDYCHRRVAEDENDPRIDLKKHLQDELKAVKRDAFDMVAFTHADIDHISGSTEFFELRHAATYQGGGRIKIKELWVPAAMLIEEVKREQLSDEFAILRREARHRLLEGSGIRVFSNPPELKDWLHPELRKRGEPVTARDHLIIDAGKVVDSFSLSQDGVEFFCHSPFIKHCEGGDVVRNDAALIFNVRLRADGANYDFLQIGDSTWEVLEDVVRITRDHGNDDRLRWDLYNLPHHCSYLALSDDKGKDETTPKHLVKELLLDGNPGAYIVSSSDPIPDSADMYKQDQPPHIQARKAYKRHLDLVGGRRLLVTMEEPNASKPKPLVFEVTAGGVSWVKALTGAPALLGAAAPRAGLATLPSRMG